MDVCCLSLLVWSCLLWLSPQTYPPQWRGQRPVAVGSRSLGVKPRPVWTAPGGSDTPCPWIARLHHSENPEEAVSAWLCELCRKTSPRVTPECSLLKTSKSTQLRWVFAGLCSPVLPCGHRFHFLIDPFAFASGGLGANPARRPSSVRQIFSFAAGWGGGGEARVALLALNEKVLIHMSVRGGGKPGHLL